MRNTLHAAILIVPLLLTQTAWAQETREAICAPVGVTSLRDRVQLQCADAVRAGGGSGVRRPFSQYGHHGAGKRKNAGCAISGDVYVAWNPHTLREGVPLGRRDQY